MTGLSSMDVCSSFKPSTYNLYGNIFVNSPGVQWITLETVNPEGQLQAKEPGVLIQLYMHLSVIRAHSSTSMRRGAMYNGGVAESQSYTINNYCIC